MYNNKMKKLLGRLTKDTIEIINLFTEIMKDSSCHSAHFVYYYSQNHEYPIDELYYYFKQDVKTIYEFKEYMEKIFQECEKEQTFEQLADNICGTILKINTTKTYIVDLISSTHYLMPSSDRVVEELMVSIGKLIKKWREYFEDISDFDKMLEVSDSKLRKMRMWLLYYGIYFPTDNIFLSPTILEED